MSRIISFAWTTPALLAGHKTVTRREWTEKHARGFHAGDLVQAWDKTPRVKGARQVAVIRIIRDPYQEPAALAPLMDWAAEGFGYLSQIRATLNGQTPIGIWQRWRAENPTLWVVRFELVEVLDAAPQA